MPLIVDGITGVTFNDASLQGAAASPFGLKNRIINGDMVIDQRNSGASVTPTNGSYGLDRWTFAATQASKFTAQQNAGAVTPPAGFTNYLGITSTSAYSITSGDIFYVRQPIEGFNVADLAFGTANARTVTLSFWIRSSLTGTFGGALQNSAENRSYPFSYTISAADTWEQKSITIPGDTTGTWLTNNGIGLSVIFGLGVGSTFTGTAGSWQGAQDFASTGAVSVVGTNGATWYLTGVQLEIGTSATPFERRMYTTELQLCQRYYFRATPNSGGIGQGGAAVFVAPNASEAMGNNVFPVTMRAAPTIMFFDNAGTQNSVHRFGIADSGATVTAGWISTGAWLWVLKSSSWATGNVLGALYNASAEL
jgi:hypothetical protein